MVSRARQFLLTAALVASCTQTAPPTTGTPFETTGPDRAGIGLEAARQRWAASPIDDYELEIEELENHWLRGCRWTTKVVAGVVVDSSWSATTSNVQICPDEDWTVELLFELIEFQSLDIERASGPEFGDNTHLVTYDERGVPSLIEYDLADGDDEERTLIISFMPSETR